MSKFKHVTHCIFDLDGLLLDTEILYNQAIQQILDQFNKVYTFDVKLTVMGLNHEDLSKRIVQIYELPITWQEYSAMQHAQTKKIMLNANLMPGAERLLRHLSDHNVPFALATSSGEEMVDIKIARYRALFKLFSHRVCGSTDKEVKKGKPAPDIFLVAASRFPDQPSPKNCLVFEDAPIGVKAAVAAGMQVVMVPDEKVPAALRSEATQVLQSLDEFQPELYGLPAYPKTP